MIISKINNLSAEPKDFELQSYVNFVRDGATQDTILKIRNTESKEERTKLKASLPSVVFGGVFKNKVQKANLVEKTGLIGLDIDGLDISELNTIRKTLENDAYSIVVNVSAGGKGFCVVMKYKLTNDFTQTFAAIEKYYLEEYGIILDAACKNINRLRFISYDPDVYYSTKSRTWTQVFKEENVKKHDRIIFVKSDFDEVVKEIQTKGIDLSDDDYSKYRALGFAISDAFQESGRDYFHIICQAGTKYKQSATDKHYTNFCKAKGHGITLATFYHFCKEKGINTYSEKTKTIIKRATTLKRSGITNEGVIDNLSKFEDIEESESKEIVDQIFNSNHDFLKAINKQDDKNDTQILLEYMRENHILKRNEITRRIENNQNVVLDADLNSMYIRAKIELGDTKVFRGDFDSIVFSNFTKIYNPIDDFIKENINDYKHGQNLMNQLANTILKTDETKRSINSIFIKKWLVGMIAMGLKEGVSPLTLVLCGGQNTGKTEWFRRLLPDDLKYLYSESKLDKEKDDEILMTQKLLIVDDEFGGKSKADEKRFKELSSKRIFTLRSPYGRMNEDIQRLASLGGTTNETSILSDHTGNRRLIPILVEKIEHKTYNNINKVDLFLEAYTEFKNGFNYELSKQEIELLNENTTEFESVDMLEELFLKYFSLEPKGEIKYLTNTEILLTIQSLSQIKSGTTMNGKRLGAILKKLGVEKQGKRINGKMKQLYPIYENQNFNPFPAIQPTF